MGRYRHTTGRAGKEQSGCHLNAEPKADVDQGRPAKAPESHDIDRDQHVNSGAWEHHDIGAQQARDGTTGTDDGGQAFRVDGRLDKSAGDTGDEKQHREAKMAQRVFNRRRENPEIQQVAQQMQPSAMQKLGGDQCENRR